MKKTWPVIHLQSVDSTNNYANKLLIENRVSEEFVIAANFQENGKGQPGNSWHSEKNKNLLFSLVLFTDFVPVNKQFFLSQAISLGIVDFLKDNNIQSSMKWPNDIIAENKKIAGILIENSVMNNSLLHSIIGIGLNVNQTDFEKELSDAISMKNITSEDYSLHDKLNSLLIFLKYRIKLLKEKRFERLRTDYLQNIYKIREQQLFIASNKIFKGFITDVEPSGELVILSEEGKKLKFLFKEIQFID